MPTIITDIDVLKIPCESPQNLRTVQNKGGDHFKKGGCHFKGYPLISGVPWL